MMDDYGGFLPPLSTRVTDDYGDEFTPRARCAHRGLPEPDVDNVYNEAALTEQGEAA